MQDNTSTEHKDSTVQDPQQYVDDKLMCKHTTYRIYTDSDFLKNKKKVLKNKNHKLHQFSMHSLKNSLL